MKLINHKAKRRGFSLIEMMVVIVIMGLITTVVATLFSKGSYALQHGDAHNTLQRGYRLLTARITPYLASAFDAQGVMQGACILDHTDTTSNQYTQAPVDSTGVSYLSNNVRFITTEDFLAPGYPSLGNSATTAQSLADLRVFVYQITVNGNNNVVLQKRDQADSFNVVLDGGLPVEKPLFFSRENAAIVQDPARGGPLRFYHPAADIIIMEVTLTSDTSGEITRKVKPTQTFRTTFSLPGKIDG